MAQYTEQKRQSALSNKIKRSTSTSLTLFFQIIVISLLTWLGVSSLISIMDNRLQSKNAQSFEIDFHELMKANPDVVIAPESEDKLPFSIIYDAVSSSLLNQNNGLESTKISIDSLCKRIESSLLEIPSIESALVSFTQGPSRFLIRYALRKPIAFIQHKSSNETGSLIAVDMNGSAFHFNPIYPPKELPFLVLPEGALLSEKNTQRHTAKELQQSIQSMQAIGALFGASQLGFFEETIESSRWVFRLVQCDFSKLSHFCYFQREAVVTLSGKRVGFPQKVLFFFRLHPDFLKQDAHGSLTRCVQFGCSSCFPCKERRGERLESSADCAAVIFDLRFKDFCLYQHIPSFQSFEDSPSICLN